jgi:hypothetical protein
MPVKMNCGFLWSLPTIALAVCGCASPVAPAAAESIEFVLSYLPAEPMNLQSGIVVVRPPPGRMFVGSAPDATVELRLPYEPPQVLSRMNFGPKAPADHRYVFQVPATFASGRFSCGAGQPLTEVKVTDVGGATLSRTVALCPGVALNAEQAFN